jgi:hypothetical protein
MGMETFTPHLAILPPPQQALWEELYATGYESF